MIQKGNLSRNRNLPRLHLQGGSVNSTFVYEPRSGQVQLDDGRVSLDSNSHFGQPKGGLTGLTEGTG